MEKTLFHGIKQKGFKKIMKKLCNLAAILLAAAAVNSCSNVDPVSPEEIKIPEKGLFAVVDNPVPFDDTGTTKAINTAMKFEWTGTEKIDVYTSTAGEKMTYRVKSYDNTAKSCVFKILNFGLLDDTYYAMIPAQGLEDDPEAVPVTILGQNQSVDNNTAHLTKYDYNVASAEVVDNSGSFAFTHRVCWVKSTLTIPDACTAKSVTLTSGENAFATDGYLNVVTKTFTPTAYSSSVTLTLSGADGIEVAAGGTLTVYFTLFSCTSEDLTISLDAVKDSEPVTYSSPVRSIMGMPYGAFATRDAIFASDGLKAVAQIGSTYYSSLVSAVAAVPTDGTETTITMLTDEVISYSSATGIEVAATKNIVIDLNGHKVTGSTDLTSTSQLFYNKGTLTVKGGTIEQGANPAWVYGGGDDYEGSYASNMFRNEGILNITDGTYKVVTNGSAAYIVDNYYSGILNVTGGTLDAKNTAIRLFYGSNQVNVSGGSITAGGYDIVQFVNGSSTSSINITGGTFSTEGSFNVYGWAENAANSASLTVEGGTFDAWVATSGQYSTDNVEISGGNFYGVYSYATVAKMVKGGLFTVSPASFLKDGYKVVENTDPATSETYPYTIAVDPDVEATLTGNTTGFGNWN